MRKLIAIVFAIALLAGSSRARAQLLSPGPLTKPHASVEGDQHCNDCHAAGKRVEQALCIKCHQDVGGRISAGQGLHGREYKGKACEGCHVEHQGARLVRWPGGDPSKLDHALTGWALSGAHKPLACGKCHNKANSRGAATYLGLGTACASCHKDPHGGRFGTSCTNCHDDGAWKNLKLEAFSHDLARFPLRGAHQKVACTKCHSDPPRYAGVPFEACTSCHKDPHAGKLGPTCTGCHEETKWKPAQLKATAHPGVSLANGHAPVACRTCHDKGNLAAPSRGSECASCHKPTHKAPFGRACATCHGSIQWVGLPRAVGVSAHARTAFSLQGKHEQAACTGCHKPEVAREARYRGVKSDRCDGCHADKHRGEFAASQGGECASCHATTGFRPTTFGVAMHASTKFPLQGKHEAVGCSGCHTGDRPRLDLHVAKQACADCHKNPHGEQFTKEMSQGGCAHCHAAGGWDMPKIDHASWPLTGAHATARCESCHKPTREDRKTGRGASYRGVPRACAGCHDDKHAGQFRATAPLVGECSTCHATSSFAIARFDHARLGRWELTGAHAKAACAKCHAKTKLADGTEAVRWRLPSSECKYCHADPHGGGPR